MTEMKPEMKALFDKLLAGDEVEFAYANGQVFSRKTVIMDDQDCFHIEHGIDDSVTYFSRKGIEEVFRDERSAWEGDLQSEDDEIEDDGELKCPGCGWHYGSLHYVSGCGPEEAICSECMEEIGVDLEHDKVTTIHQETDGRDGWIAVSNVGGYAEQSGFVYVGESE